MMDEEQRDDNASSRGMNFIDMAVRESSAELKRLVQYYKQIGRDEEARKIDAALNRLERKEDKRQGNMSERQDH